MFRSAVGCALAFALANAACIRNTVPRVTSGIDSVGTPPSGGDRVIATEDGRIEIEPTRAEITERRLRILTTWARAYESHRGELPTGKEEISSPPDVQSIIESLERLWLDGWGNPIRFEPSAVGFTLRSLGPDGLEGTRDDMISIVRPK